MFDYIIVGGGSAGCVLAHRLSEDRERRVLLLEAGARDRSIYIRVPAGFFKLTGSRFTWGLETAPQRNANGRKMPFSQGKLLGGSSSINGMVYTRGSRADYDRWANEEGCSGWSYDEVLPYFMRAEDNNRFLNEYHGSNGPLGVSDARYTSEATRLFLKAAQQFGIPYNPDFNGQVQDGCGIYQTNTRDGRRSSASTAYLQAAKGRPNLRVITNALVSKVVIERNRAVGVEYIAKGRLVRADATQEIIISAGAFGSPKLLMLSGIGPPDHLRALRIPIVVDAPGVGRNLQDHIDVDTVYELKDLPSLDEYKSPWKRTLAGIEYFAFGDGPAASNVVEAGAFWRSSEGINEPDLQFHFLPGSGIEENTPGLGSSGGNGCTLNSYNLRPRSRGSVQLKSPDPAVAPQIDPNYWEDDYDLQRSLDGLLMSREIMNQQVFRDYIACERTPGSKVRTRGELIGFLRAFGRTAYHPVGTCKMGTDSLAVVDNELRVRGIEKLRVIDASVMPSIISSNTNAAAIMIAERATDLILRPTAVIGAAPGCSVRADETMRSPENAFAANRAMRPVGVIRQGE